MSGVVGHVSEERGGKRRRGGRNRAALSITPWPTIELRNNGVWQHGVVRGEAIAVLEPKFYVETCQTPQSPPHTASPVRMFCMRGGANGVCTPMMFVRTTKRGGQSGEVKPAERDHEKFGWEMGATFLCGLQAGQKGIPPAPEFSVSGCC